MMDLMKLQLASVPWKSATPKARKTKKTVADQWTPKELAAFKRVAKRSKAKKRR